MIYRMYFVYRDNYDLYVENGSSWTLSGVSPSIKVGFEADRLVLRLYKHAGNRQIIWQRQARLLGKGVILLLFPTICHSVRSPSPTTI